MNDSNQSVSLLAEEILKDVVQPLPVTDIHTHINGADPAAHDISEIIFYHYILSELSAAGVSAATLKAADTVEKKIALFLEWHGRLSNTITYWCLRRVLELHGINAHAELSRTALLEANERVLATHADPAWPRKALAEKNRVKQTALTLNITEKIPPFDSSLFFGTLRLDDVTGNVTQDSLRLFAAACGKAISHLDSFEKAAQGSVQNFARGGGKAVTLGLAPEEDYVPAERSVVEKLFARVLAGETLLPAEAAALHSYLLEFFAGLASESHLPLQILIGVRRPLPGGAAVAIVHPGMVSRYAPLFHKFAGLNFDIFLASAAHSQELVATAKNYPNINLSGFWWYAFSPPYIRALLTERLLALPMTKLHAFFSDAYNVEWSTGKLALLRRELSRVLAELMVSGYLGESQAPEIAKCLLSENAARLYQL
jgi:glucuronate isomerase